MRKIAPGVFLEPKYPGIHLGAIITKDGLLLVDSPARAEDGRDWLTSLGEYGAPKYLVLLDLHPDRALGARIFELPKVAHDWTRNQMSNWSDTYKGSARPIGSEVDLFKRITGLRRSVPELTFSKKMLMHLGDRQIHFWHRAGPTPGSIWVVFPEAKVAFIGDAVTVAEPPFLGEADIDAWLDTLDDLRGSDMKSYKLISSRDGLVKRQDISAMARFLRKVPWRLKQLGEEGAPPEAAAKLAPKLMKDYSIPSVRQEQVLLRLESGLTRLYSRLYPSET